MLFRVIIILLVLATVGIFTNFVFLSVVTFFWIFVILAQGAKRTRNEFRKSVLHQDTNSLMFGIKSMNVQKTNFKIINYVFRNDTSISLFFKQLSILLDDMHIKALQKTQYYDSRCSITDPSESYLHCNIYHKK